MLRGCQDLAGVLDELPVSDGCGHSLVTFLSEEQRNQLGRYIAGTHLLYMRLLQVVKRRSQFRSNKQDV